MLHHIAERRGGCIDGYDRGFHLDDLPCIAQIQGDVLGCRRANNQRDAGPPNCFEAGHLDGERVSAHWNRGKREEPGIVARLREHDARSVIRHGYGCTGDHCAAGIVNGT